MVGLKTIAREVLPRRSQVPAKYWYSWLRGALEAEMKFLGALVKRGDRVVDVGANRGVYAYQLWKLGAQVEVFEPNPICFDILSAWAVGKSGVWLHPEALSDRSGLASLHIPVDDSGTEHDASASIEHTGFAQSRDQVVQLQTLDSYGMEDVSLVKIDVEGHEYRVVEGAKATIAASRPSMLIEIEQRHNVRPVGEVFAKILDFGYLGFFLVSGRLTALHNFDVTRHQSMENFGGREGAYINNFLFLHKARIAQGEFFRLLEAAS